MARALIIGYGNPLRSDDGFGWHAAQLLSTLPYPGLEVLARQQLTLDLAETTSQFELVIFIDAARDCRPGELRCQRIPAAANRGQPQASGLSHFLTPASLLAWTAELHAKSPEAYYISVGGASFAEGDSLSPVAQAAFPALLAQIKALIAPEEFQEEPPQDPAEQL
jgi:hydrogenase maturation protease